MSAPFFLPALLGICLPMFLQDMLPLPAALFAVQCFRPIHNRALRLSGQLHATPDQLNETRSLSGHKQIPAECF